MTDATHHKFVNHHAPDKIQKAARPGTVNAEQIRSGEVKSSDFFEGLERSDAQKAELDGK